MYHCPLTVVGYYPVVFMPVRPLYYGIDGWVSKNLQKSHKTRQSLSHFVRYPFHSRFDLESLLLRIALSVRSLLSCFISIF